MDARCAVERRHHQTAVISQGRIAAALRHVMSLELGIGAEAPAGFLRIVQAKIGRSREVPDEGGKQSRHFADLAGIVAGDDQSVFGEASGHTGIDTHCIVLRNRRPLT